MTEIHQEPQSLLTATVTVGSTATLNYEKLKDLLESTVAHAVMAVQITTELKRVAVAIGVLAGKALGVHDFHYRITNGEPKTRKLRMWAETKPHGQCPEAELVLHLTAEGFVFRMSDLIIRHSNRHASLSKGATQRH